MKPCVNQSRSVWLTLNTTSGWRLVDNQLGGFFVLWSRRSKMGALRRWGEASSKMGGTRSEERKWGVLRSSASKNEDGVLRSSRPKIENRMILRSSAPTIEDDGGSSKMGGVLRRWGAGSAIRSRRTKKPHRCFSKNLPSIFDIRPRKTKKNIFVPRSDDWVEDRHRLRGDRSSTGRCVPSPVYIGFSVSVLPKTRPEQLFSMPWKTKWTVVSWAPRRRNSVLSRLALPLCGALLRPDPPVVCPSFGFEKLFIFWEVPSINKVRKNKASVRRLAARSEKRKLPRGKNDRQRSIVFLHFRDMPCMKRVWKDKKASFHWSAARNKEGPSSRG